MSKIIKSIDDVGSSGLLSSVPLVFNSKKEIEAERQTERMEAKKLVRRLVDDNNLNQRQILYVIRNLALEIEKSSYSRRMYDLAKECIEEITISI
jgi:hypothetical protein